MQKKIPGRNICSCTCLHKRRIFWKVDKYKKEGNHVNKISQNNNRITAQTICSRAKNSKCQATNNFSNAN